VTAPLFTILLEDDVAVDPRKYGPLAAAALGVTALEGKLLVRKGRGIFLENVPEEHATRIVAELEKDGVRARAVPRDGVPALPAPRRATALEHGEDLLTCAGLAPGEREAVPWDAILVASVGAVAREEYKDLFGHVPFHMIPPMHKLEGGEREVVRENLILKMSAAPPDRDLARGRRRPDSIFEEIEQKYSGKVRVFADLVTADLGTWLRVPLEEIGYVYMAGGVRLGGAWGFQLLVNDLKEKAAGAFPEMTLKLLDAVDIKELVFPQIEEFTRYTAWAALKRTLWPNAGTSSPSPEPPESSTDAGSSSASPGPAPPSTSS
jgi:hypothetical protein